MGYVSQWHSIGKGVRVLEIGCGEGGNLLPFSQAGCSVMGIEIVDYRVEEAQQFFKTNNSEGTFLCADFLTVAPPEEKFDIVLLHDVIEHITYKEKFLSHIMDFMSPKGILFAGFPAWQMPFGGHQQICHSRLCSHFPFLHLLPMPLYQTVLRYCGETEDAIDELADIKKCGMSVGKFENIIKRCRYKILDRTLWMVNPHYRQKFGFTPRKLWNVFSHIPYLRNFITSSCWFCLGKR